MPGVPRGRDHLTAGNFGHDCPEASPTPLGTGGIRIWADADVVALEGLHEGLGHSIALRAFDWSEARHQIKRHGDFNGLLGREDRAVVGKPLYWMRRTDRAEALLDAVNHHVTDHLAGDAGGGSAPADDLAVVAIEREGDAHHLAIPARELEAVGAPADVGAQRRHLPIMFARASPTSMSDQ